MQKEIEDRLIGLESIIYGVHHKLQLMEYMSFGLHKERFNLFNNQALYLIWGLLMGSQILDFYKIISKDEKFSFTKIINIAKGLKAEINYELIERKVAELEAEYKKTDFETIRSKYLAHQDLNVPELRTGLTTISSFTEKIIEIFRILSDEFKRQKVDLSSEVVDSLKQIFITIDVYEEVKAFLIADRIQGRETVEISKIAEIIKRRDKDG